MNDAPQPAGGGADVALIEIPAHHLVEQRAPLHEVAGKKTSGDGQAIRIATFTVGLTSGRGLPLDIYSSIRLNRYMRADTKGAFKDSLFGEFARIGKAMASGRRLELIELLAQGSRTVEALAAETRQTVANTSQHLQVLRHAHLVEPARHGNHIRYRLADESVVRLWIAMRHVGESRLAEVDRLVKTYLSGRTGLQAVTCEELRRRMDRGRVVVLDVRPAPEFQAAHIAGARSIPVDELAARLKDIPRRTTIVAYCRGPYCVFADDAVAVLRSKGFNALRLEGGLPDWRLQGGPVETGAEG
jgi:rhodanese-related sulfurtransferase/DNA-binding transcriptional ArsR family regulator